MGAVVLKFLPIIAALITFGACSQDGAQAQSTRAPAAVEKINAPDFAVDFDVDWKVDANKSTLSFSGDQGGEIFTGSFGRFTPLIKFDPQDLASARVHVRIDLTSADAGDTDRNEALPGEDWFAVKSFPMAAFNADQFNALGENRYEAIGAIRIKDVSKPLTLPFTLDIDGDTATMNGAVSINRLDFNIGAGTWESEDWVGHKVDIRAFVTATRK